jgi:hypothetical protein
VGVTAWDQSPKLPVFVLWVRVEANAQGPWGPIDATKGPRGPRNDVGPAGGSLVKFGFRAISDPLGSKNLLGVPVPPPPKPSPT